MNRRLIRKNMQKQKEQEENMNRWTDTITLHCNTVRWTDEQIQWHYTVTLSELGTLVYTVSQQNIPDVFSYNSRKHWRIFIIFGRNVTEKASNHMLLHFLTSAN